eukprot:TRINITY_DN1453_c0_g1_i1.p1 TRINITY_DN1453_c0_g1~~TRINITY_DN1453_c0_g1_i1.p1  ORF type:complete len:463 (+),score=123.10 TRINITY_DN1453_c0_g1_i1:40-1428(+)
MKDSAEVHPLLINTEEDKRRRRIARPLVALLVLIGLLLITSTIVFVVLFVRAEGKIKVLVSPPTPVTLGGQVLINSGFSQLANQKVGLITNPTAVYNSVHIIDWMFFTPNDHNMSLVSLFGPEHGLRGSEPDGTPIGNTVDPRTNLPVYSLYGNDVRAPTKQMLEGVTALVFDIQDVGVRFYTYISTMGLCMQSAAANNIPFIVLDRPNLLGGSDSSVSGWILEADNQSFIGEYPIPVQYGLSSGELALMIQGKAMLTGLENLTISVIKMENYSRSMTYLNIQLPWISPSPNLVDFEATMLYPGTGFFEAFELATEGRGTLSPFKIIGAPWADSTSIINSLSQYNLPGVSFSPATFIPVNITGMSSTPKFLNQIVNGIQIHVTDYNNIKPVELGVYLFSVFYTQCPQALQQSLINSQDLDLHAGSHIFYEQITSNVSPQQIISGWSSSVEQFLEDRKPFLLY